MILKRIAKGIKDQDWFVVTIEIVIVVIGIFLGMQVTDWNERQQESKALDKTLDRFVSESEGNLTWLKTYFEEYSEANMLVQKNFHALLSCSTDQTAIETFENTLDQVFGTRVPLMQIDALIDVTEKDRYTNLMREGLLNLLKQYKRNILAALKEVDGNEDLAWKNIPYNQPIITLEEDDGGFYGGTRFALKLPFSEACKDDNFKKAYFDYGIILDLNVIYAKRLLDETEALMMLLKDYR